MTIRHLPLLDPERWYVITVDRATEERRPAWQHHEIHLHGPNSGASISWNVLTARYGWNGFGFGFRVGRNGGESDLGLDLYAGALGSIWTRLRAPWLRWARVTQIQDRDEWYLARHTGFRFFPREDVWFEFNIEDRDGLWHHGQPWWRSWSFGKRQVMGRFNCDLAVEETGECRIPLPEGVYPATWERKVRTWRYRRPLGSWRDRIVGLRTRVDYSIDIPGGIPIEGKGENSWDCGMDGLFGTGGRSLEEAIGHCVEHVLRGRARYGGPHDLPHPMTVSEAGARGRG